MVLDETSFENLYYGYSDRLQNYVRHYVEDSSVSKDIVHEAYTKLWEHYRGTDADRPERILFRIVRNRSFDYLKAATIRNADAVSLSMRENVCEDSLYALDLGAARSDGKTLYDELAAQIDSILVSLPEKCAEVFRMSRFSGMKNKEIAETLGISEKAVEKHIAKAIKEFRRKLSASGYIDSAVRTALVFILAVEI